MSDALRTIFAEFGFEVDTATLEKLDKRLKETIGTTKKAAKGTDDAAKSQKAKAKADKKAAAESKALSRQLSTYSGIVDHISTKAHERFGEGLLKRFPQISEAAKKYGVDAEGVGKVVVGATAAVVAGMALATRAAFSFVTKNAEQLGIPKSRLGALETHIHVPQGAIPKDGPSAGITMTTALASLLNKQFKPKSDEAKSAVETAVRVANRDVGNFASAHSSKKTR